MSLINLPDTGDIAFFQELEPKSQIVYTWTECPKPTYTGKYIFWITKDDKIVQKGCWAYGEEPGTLVEIVVEENTNEPAPDLIQVKVRKDGIKI